MCNDHGNYTERDIDAKIACLTDDCLRSGLGGNLSLLQDSSDLLTAELVDYIFKQAARSHKIRRENPFLAPNPSEEALRVQPRPRTPRSDQAHGSRDPRYTECQLENNLQRLRQQRRTQASAAVFPAGDPRSLSRVTMQSTDQAVLEELLPTSLQANLHLGQNTQVAHSSSNQRNRVPERKPDVVPSQQTTSQKRRPPSASYHTNASPSVQPPSPFFLPALELESRRNKAEIEQIMRDKMIAEALQAYIDDEVREEERREEQRREERRGVERERAERREENNLCVICLEHPITCGFLHRSRWAWWDETTVYSATSICSYSIQLQSSSVSYQYCPGCLVKSSGCCYIYYSDMTDGRFRSQCTICHLATMDEHASQLLMRLHRRYAYCLCVWLYFTARHHTADELRNPVQYLSWHTLHWNYQSSDFLPRLLYTYSTSKPYSKLSRGIGAQDRWNSYSSSCLALSSPQQSHPAGKSLLYQT